jgi:hypothetical protein
LLSLRRGPDAAEVAPPTQLFAPAIRKQHAPQLLTIPVHDACNKAYQLDEDYFVHTLIPFARRRTPAAQSAIDATRPSQRLCSAIASD